MITFCGSRYGGVLMRVVTHFGMPCWRVIIHDTRTGDSSPHRLITFRGADAHGRAFAYFDVYRRAAG